MPDPVSNPTDPLSPLRQTAGASGTGTSLESAGLDRDAFLKLFLAQIENQDPLSPEDASELGVHLAQFSQLEQSIIAADELAGVNTNLKAVLEALGARSGSAIDPVGLIGRTVEVDSAELMAPVSGRSASLAAPVAKRDGEFLLVEAFDGDDRSLGMAAVSSVGADGRPIALAPGSYQLFFEDGQARLVRPGGAADGESLALLPYTKEADGTIVIGQAPPGSTWPAVRAGETYRFELKLVRGSGSGTPAREPIVPTRSGVVSGVRMVAGEPRLLIDGSEVDPDGIRNIR